MLPNDIVKEIESAIKAVEFDIDTRKTQNDSYEDLDLIRTELIEMKSEKRKQPSDVISRIIIDSMDWDQPCLKNFNHVCSLLRKHFHLRP